MSLSSTVHLVSSLFHQKFVFPRQLKRMSRRAVALIAFLAIFMVARLQIMKNAPRFPRLVWTAAHPHTFTPSQLPTLTFYTAHLYTSHSSPTTKHLHSVISFTRLIVHQKDVAYSQCKRCAILKTLHTV